MTYPVAVPQFRSKYIFLAPDDYATSFADIVAPEGASVTLDGAPLTASAEALVPGWVLYREPLTDGGMNGGAHVLESADSSQQVGLTVAGYGHATGYIYPGGLNIKLISKIPVVVVK
jgi:hypothetical protein